MRKIISIVICAVMLVLLLPGITAYAEGEELYVHQQGFASDHKLTGLFSSFTEGFNTGNWKYSDAKLTLCFSVTPLLLADVSDYTVSLNGQNFYSGRIPLTKGQTVQTVIDMPIGFIINGYNTVTVETYIRTNEQDPCSDDISTASWLTVLSDSSFSITYTPLDGCTNISEFYNKFTSIEALENKQSAVCVPANPSENSLTAASLAITGMAANSVFGYDNMALIRSDEISSAYKYILYISDFKTLPSSMKSLLTSDEQSMISDNNCIMALTDISGCKVLIMTGNEDSLIKGAKALMNGDYMGQVSSQWARIASDADVQIRNESLGTTSKLTKSGSYVKGPFRQSALFHINNPANRQIDKNSKVSLVFRYSDNLNFDRSLITAYINDTPIGSQKLTKEKAQSDTAVFDLPDDLEITGAFTIKVSFDLEVQDMYCTERQDEMPWGYITSESTITLNTKETQYLLFENFPSPFVYDGRLNDVTEIIPDSPSDADIEMLRSFAVTFGRFATDNSGQLKVVFKSDMGDLSQSNIIAIGRIENNPLAQQLNNQLYFQFSPEQTTIRSNEKIVIDPNYGATLGTAQLLNSPYSSKKYGLLIISGVRDSGILNVATYLGSVNKLWEVYGDGFVADGKSNHSFRFKTDNVKTESFWEKFSQRSDLVVLIILCFAVVVILLSVIIVLQVRKRRSNGR